MRDNITTHFARAGMAVPENLLQYLYGWGAASFILSAYAQGNLGPLNFYSIIANFGRMNIGDMAGTFDLIKQGHEPRNREINMVEEYQSENSQSVSKKGVKKLNLIFVLYYSRQLEILN